MINITIIITNIIICQSWVLACVHLGFPIKSMAATCTARSRSPHTVHTPPRKMRIPTVGSLPPWRDMNPNGNALQFVCKWSERRALVCPVCEKTRKAEIMLYCTETDGVFSYVHCSTCKSKDGRYVRPLMMLGARLRNGECLYREGIADRVEDAGF